MSTSSMDSTPGPVELIARVDAEAARLAAEVWSVADDEWASLLYERAATAALRAPVLADRSIVLRRIVKRVTPRALVPTVKRVVKLFDEASRRLVDVASSRRSRS